MNGGIDERTGLLSNGDSRRRSTVAEFFLSKTYTPGMDSENKFVAWPAHAFNTTKVTLLSNYVNVLLIFVPLGIIAGATGWSPTTVFILNFFAIVPLAALLSFATEEISVKLGETLGGLLNATFGNAVELIVSLFFPRDIYVGGREGFGKRERGGKEKREEREHTEEKGNSIEEDRGQIKREKRLGEGRG
jgi:Ca2+:H+ antiporter